MSDLASRSEAYLRALMRTDRQVQNRRRDRQALLDLEATEESAPAKRRVVRRTRKVARCPVCDVGPDQHCEMCGSFENCPRILPRKLSQVATMSGLAERVASLEMALVEMLAKCSFAKREQWCGCIDCHCMIARCALRSSPSPRQPQPSDDKIRRLSARSNPRGAPRNVRRFLYGYLSIVRLSDVGPIPNAEESNAGFPV
jgi:hypothetical protein